MCCSFNRFAVYLASHVPVAPENPKRLSLARKKVRGSGTVTIPSIGKTSLRRNVLSVMAGLERGRNAACSSLPPESYVTLLRAKRSKGRDAEPRDYSGAIRHVRLAASESTGVEQAAFLFARL